MASDVQLRFMNGSIQRYENIQDAYDIAKLDISSVHRISFHLVGDEQDRVQYVPEVAGELLGWLRRDIIINRCSEIVHSSMIKY